MPRIKARSNLWIDGQRIEADSFADLSEEQIRMLPKGFIYEMEEPGAVSGVLEPMPVIDTPAAAKNAAMALLRPFLKVSEEEAKLAISELLHGGPEEMPPIVEPVVDWPLNLDADKTKAPRQSRRKAGGE